MARGKWRGGLACIAGVTLALGVQAAAQQLRLPADIIYGNAGASSARSSSVTRFTPPSRISARPAMSRSSGCSAPRGR